MSKLLHARHGGNDGRKERTMTIKEYREFLINGIMDFIKYAKEGRKNIHEFTRDELKKKATRSLERIYDNI